MAEKNIKLIEAFPPVSTEDWEAKIQADLKGKDYEKATFIARSNNKCNSANKLIRKSLGMGDLLGTLEAGKLADFAVLEDDPWSMPEEELSKTRVKATFRGGECIHGKI